MLDIIIIVLILIGLTIHRYLTTFWEQGELPYPHGFTIFANLFALIYLVSFIWMFGIIGGIIVSILCYFQITYSTLLWIILLPWLLLVHNPKSNFQTPQVNPFIYGAFSFVVVILVVLTIAGFFISNYQSMLKYFDSNIWIIVVGTLVTILVGNVIRMIVMSKLINR